MSTTPARPTVYNGIRMRSRLEAYAAQAFDRAGQPWEYEPRCFASEDGQYLPDFFLPMSPRRQSDNGPPLPTGDYVEIKPASFYHRHLDALGRGVDPLQVRMRVIYASDPRAALILWFPELGEAFVSGWWEPTEWYHQGPWRISLPEQYLARHPQTDPWA